MEEGSGWHVPASMVQITAAGSSLLCSWQAEYRLLQVSAVPHLEVQMHNVVAVQIDQAADHVQQQGGTCRQVNLMNLVSSWVAWVLALNANMPELFADLQGDTA